MTAWLIVALAVALLAVAVLAVMWRTETTYSNRAHAAYKRERIARLAAEQERGAAVRVLLGDLNNLTPEDFR
ncbi:hypothetical protein [Micromonospora chersina]|uniref:hypothetical protein n=1 Tax=Micromonospora chersina TaxID=47854 RepID=UPI003723E365